MKVAPLIKAATDYNARCRDGERRFDCRLVHTGQHYDRQMSEIFFEELRIPAPDVNLEVGSGSHAAQTANIMLRFEPVCLQEKPDWVVVVGDVNSTVACTLVASKLGMRVAHIEAGLRSLDRSMPEEINRLVTDALADLLLTPSPDADANLHREGIAPAKIRCVGNIMIDALVTNLVKAREGRALDRLGLEPRRFAYVTLHRPSNVDEADTLAAIIAELKRIALSLPVVFAMHPRTRDRAARFGVALDGNRRLKIIEPLGYHDSLALAEQARLVLTDSGGLQEETTWFRTPCLTLRPNTERPITISLGSNRLTRVELLERHLAETLSGPERTGSIPPLWDGQTAGRILNLLT
jgi:UDP-N-acetylglucosamine 2-epimerase (non-hydrolysing)